MAQVEGEVLIKQGAEALAYISHILPHSRVRCVRKHRPPKPYRHPVLDARLTTHRILAEARLLSKLRRSGVAVPAVLFVDVKRGDLWMEFVPGSSVRDYLFSLQPPTNPSIDDLPMDHAAQSVVEADAVQEEVRMVMAEIGRVVAGMHDAEIVHGDLTTSNLLLRPASEGSETSRTRETGVVGRVVVIDLGLGSVSLSSEDAAVDLYVLERAFLSTHPDSARHFDTILQAYAEHAKKGREVLKRLNEVRRRGRKRTMVG